MKCQCPFNVYKATIFLLFTFLIGCSKSFLNTAPSDAVTVDNALGTPSALNDALTGAYANLRSVALFGKDFLVVGDLQADNTFVEIKNLSQYIPQYNYSVVSNDLVVSEMWATAYKGILAVNQIINATVTGTNVPQIKAQAFAMRALLYFKLVNIFARPYTDDPSALGVPLVLAYSPEALPKRNTVKEVYTQIITDLQSAFKDAPAYTSSVRLSKYAIEALLARSYFYMGDYTNAKTAAVDVINNSGFTLALPSAFKAFWANPSIQTNQVEVMFEIDADAVNNNGANDIAGIYINGSQDIYASTQLYNLYSSTDVRKTLMLTGTTKSGAPAVLVNKFSNALNADRDNLKVIRLAEIYLIAAESSLPANETDAKKYLNGLLAQRDTVFTGYASTGPALLNDIAKERRKELAFEGDRLYDLNRLKLPIARTANAGAISAGTGDINLNISYADYRRIAPIPQSEIQSNSNIAGQQNIGY